MSADLRPSVWRVFVLLNIISGFGILMQSVTFIVVAVVMNSVFVFHVSGNNSFVDSKGLTTQNTVLVQETALDQFGCLKKSSK